MEREKQQKIEAQKVFNQMFENHLIDFVEFEKNEDGVIQPIEIKEHEIRYIFRDIGNMYNISLDYKTSILLFCEENNVTIDFIWETATLTIN